MSPRKKPQLLQPEDSDSLNTSDKSTAKERQLEIINKRISTAQITYNEQILEMRKGLVSYTARTEDARLELTKLRREANSERATLAQLKKEIAGARIELTDAKDYLAEQQSLIDESIEEGNLTLKALKYE